MRTMYFVGALATSLALTVPVFGAVTKVTKTGRGPTGYVVDFVFTPNATEQYSSVLLGGFPFFSDPLHASPSKTNGYSPWQWKADDFSMSVSPDYGVPNITSAGLNMTWNVEEGSWQITVPLPSGTWNYAYYPECTRPWSYCDEALADPSNMPIEAYPGDQLVSTIQVPFDGNYQVNDYDWQLPLPDTSNRGSVSFHQYPSPGSTYPSPGVHEFGIYLPKEYGSIPGKKYPILYLHHGGDGLESDWFSQGRAHNIIDRLIDRGDLEPTVIVTPNFYNLGFTEVQFETNATLAAKYEDVAEISGFSNAVRENYNQYLFPWIDANFNVSTEPMHRAFGGLSLGGGLALNMLFNSTGNFSSFAIMSATPPPDAGSSAYYDNAELHQVGIFTGAGFYDMTFMWNRNLEDALSQAGISYLSHFPQNGAHQWSTWQEMLYIYLKTALWKDVPYTLNTSARLPETLSGGVPY